MIPELEAEGAEWPSLGPSIVRWIEANLTFGPGDLRGMPAKVDGEKQAFISRMYEVYPLGAKDANGKPIHGRRRFRRCCLSVAKGQAKTELAAWLAACELHPDAPVRCYDFDSTGRTPTGRGVTDPYIALVAYTEEQTEDLAYAALKVMVEESVAIRGDFDIGLERIMRKTGDGKAVALAGSPNARDGARTTFQHKDETHRWNSDRLRRAATTMTANLPKRLMADPWELETTTAFTPGENSVAEQSADYAKGVREHRIKDSRLFYFHRQAGDGHDLGTPEGIRAAVVEACGPTVAWRDIEGICDQWQDPGADLTYLERVWLNRTVAASAQAFDATKWKASAHLHPDADHKLQLITLGFDGSLNDDSTALIATCVLCGWQWPVGLWEKDFESWEVPRPEVDAAVDQAFADFEVWRMYSDPSKWEADLARWAGRHGDKRVVGWPTTHYRKMATALKSYASAIVNGDISNNGDARVARHIGNAVRSQLNFKDDDGSPLWLIQKDRRDSPNKIDAAMAGCMSWQARLDAVASGATNEQWNGIFIPQDDDD